MFQSGKKNTNAEPAEQNKVNTAKDDYLREQRFLMHAIGDNGK